MMGYLEAFAPILLMVGSVFIGAYIAPYVLTLGERIPDGKKQNASYS